MHSRTLNTIPARPVVFARSQWRDRQRIRIVIAALASFPVLWGLLAAACAIVGKN